ncbi:MAG: hypothetical protein QG594_1372 [Bacteroidota bacterium]|nr:hypothetical protein [Bacteroidota bacterium]
MFLWSDILSIQKSILDEKMPVKTQISFITLNFRLGEY